MQSEQQPAILASPLAGEDVSRVQSLAQIIAYHERSKHTLERYAAGPEALDWDAQPNPFREFEGTQRIRLPLVADTLTASFDELHVPNGHVIGDIPDEKNRNARPPNPRYALPNPPPEGEGTNESLREYQITAISPQPLTLDSIAAMMELSFGISAWKQYGPDMWAVRCNPSSGNLHPTEAYVVCRKISGIEDGVYHYISRDHSLEQRARFSVSPSDAPRLLVGISSITWREAWKYGERAFRYCQLDTGHAIGALRYAAATLGWVLHIRDDCSHQELAQYLGLNRDSDFIGAEREEAELLMEITTAQSASLSNTFESVQEWHGHANILDAHPMYRWPVIGEVAEASRKISASSATDMPCENYPTLNSDADIPHRDIKAATLIRQRRSAQRFDARFTQDAASFYRMLDALLPRANAPWDIWQQAARIHPVLFVHRVSGLAPGLYALPRSHSAQLQSAMRRDFLWTKPAGCPDHLPLFLLTATDTSKAAKIMNCHQAIAGDSTFALAMLAEFDAPLNDAPWNYRRLYWEAGLLGQVLYLEAEATGLRGTGIGCFFDDVCHELLGLQDKTFQSLYHFTVGYPLTDERIVSLPPYP